MKKDFSIISFLCPVIVILLIISGIITIIEVILGTNTTYSTTNMDEGGFAILFGVLGIFLYLYLSKPK